MDNRTEVFIEKAKLIHGDRYDYSKVVYIDKKTKIEIICKEHGSFKQQPRCHLINQGCPKCATILVSKKNQLSTDDFIKKAKLIHGDRYDYSKTIYSGISNKLNIICKIHGVFTQSPASHYAGRGCQVCSSKILTTSEFIEKARKIHGDKYDYSKVVYKHHRQHVEIICKEHGSFFQIPRAHIDKKHGCNLCLNKNKFISTIKRIHGDRYDYSLMNYRSAFQKIKIICKIHGVFTQVASDHGRGAGCIFCNKKTINTDRFIKEAKLIHGDTYDYTKSYYKNARTKVCIICKKHGEFLQSWHEHVKCGCQCPSCSHLVSKKEIKWLDQIGVPKEFRNQKIRINKRLIKPDAVDVKNKIIWEFFGDLWHGNPNVFNYEKTNPYSKKSFKILYQKTIQRMKFLEENGYKVIYIWESEYDKIKNK